MVWKLKELRKDDDDARKEIWHAKLSYPTYRQIYTRRQGVFWCYRHSFEPPCECSKCVQQFLSQEAQKHQMTTYSFALADVEARKKAAEFATDISKNLVYLRQQCQNNGDAIIKRWKKKSRNKREGLLRDIDPNLYPHRWPLVHLNEAFQATVPPDDWISADITLSRFMRGYRNACLLRYINLEGLIENPVMLLSLLRNRTQYSPEQWAPYGNSILDKHWDIDSLALDYNSNSMILAGSAYGTLTQWKSEEAHRWTSVGFPRAILILEAQAHLLSFLRSTAERILGPTIGYSMKRYIELAMTNEVEKLKSLQISLNESRDPLKPLSKAYDAALGSLEALLLDQIRRRSKYLGSLLPMYLQEYKITALSTNHGTLSGWQRKDTVSYPEYSKDRLDFCLALLLLDMRPDCKLEDVSPLTPAMIFAMLEEHLAKCDETKNFKELARLDETIYTVISSLAAMHQMLEMVRLHRPRAKKREAENIVELEHSRGWRYVEKHLEYQAKESRLKSYWQTPPRHLWRHQIDPEHIAAIEKLNAEVHAEIGARHAKKVAAFENFIDQEQWGTEKSEKLGVPTRSKIKTRKLPNTDDEHNTVETISKPTVTPETSALISSPKVLVRKSSYAIFQTMFPTRNFEERTKTVPWDSLVNAMAEAGFIASHDAGGSAVQFEPDTNSPWFGQGKIVFHKPHPERVVDAIMLGAMGKRMKKWFGWSDETFEVGKK
ncbi:hypothetical protein BTUL_0017g00980 [Botrytis tulipae]|uniref:Clr5 domain-containing protein n=1 Tax=Botrytis tulipae TaxID=87230 RepID=A0A4Z1F8D2_9HELO|nr:hypothetical protein BTUL_0017g00980 [Botrytis tulipae]